MKEDKEVSPGESGTTQGQSRETLLRPPVDIFEDAAGITVRADMPGVSRDHLNIQVDKDTLLVEGHAQLDLPKDMEALHADMRASHYRRSFALSGELDPDKIEASLKDGVLSLRIPKRAEVQPRKVQVRVG